MEIKKYMMQTTRSDFYDVTFVYASGYTRDRFRELGRYLLPKSSSDVDGFYWLLEVRTAGPGLHKSWIRGLGFGVPFTEFADIYDEKDMDYSQDIAFFLIKGRFLWK